MGSYNLHAPMVRTLPRRTLLRGVGISLGLPLLDAMRPVVRCAEAPPARLVAVYLGNGMNMGAWTPTSEGELRLSPTLAPLGPLAGQTLVVSGLDNRLGGSTEMGGLHSRIQPAWLTGTHARRTEGADVEAGISMDQVAARAMSGRTRLPSLELALESVAISRACEPAFACTYVSTISWRDATTPMPMDPDPRSVFERLFGDTASPAARDAERRRDKSILDFLVSDLASLGARVGSRDRATVDQYVETIRDVEKRIAAAEQHTRQNPDTADLARFTGIPISYREHAGLMFDLMALALQADATRVATLLMLRERSDRVFTEAGVGAGSHALSHHEDDPVRLAEQARLNTFHMGLVAGLLTRLAALADGEGTLLDRTIVLAGAGMSDSNQHRPVDVPTVVAGGRALGLGGGRHLRAPGGTPLANLQLALLEAAGVQTARHGDSTGVLTGVRRA